MMFSQPFTYRCIVCDSLYWFQSADSVCYCSANCWLKDRIEDEDNDDR